MINLLVADDLNLNIIIDDIVNNNKSILAGNVNIIRTPYVQKKSFDGGGYKTGIEIIKEMERIDLAILDIYFEEEFGSRKKDGGKILADLIQRHHPQCQIIIMSNFQPDPEMMYEYEAFRDGKKYLSISKDIFEFEKFAQHNLVFSVALFEWFFSFANSVENISERNLLIQTILDHNDIKLAKDLKTKELKFFLNDKVIQNIESLSRKTFGINYFEAKLNLNYSGSLGIRNILDKCIFRIPEILAEKSYYTNIAPEEMFAALFKRDVNKLFSKKNIGMISRVTSLVLKNDFIIYRNGDRFTSALKNRLIPEDLKQDYQEYRSNESEIRKFQDKNGGPPYTNLSNKFTFQKDRFGNIPNSVIDEFSKISTQRIFYFFLFFIGHLKRGIIYNLLNKLSFEDAMTKAVDQFTSGRCLLKKFDTRAFRMLDNDKLQTDVRFKNIYAILPQFASYELQIIKLCIPEIKKHLSSLDMDNCICRFRLYSIESLI